MQYALEVLDDLIFDDLSPKRAVKQTLSKTALADYERKLIEGKNAALRIIRKQMRTLVSKNEIEAYVRLQQTAITDLLDEVSRFIPAGSYLRTNKRASVAPKTSVWQYCFLVLSDLFNSIKDNYPEYFDQQQKLPAAFKVEESARVRVDMGSISKLLKARGAPAALIGLLAEPAEHFLENGSTYSFVGLHYLKELQRNVLQILGGNEADIIERISEYLLFVNFNSVLFYSFYVELLKGKAAGKKDVAAQIDFYSWEMKILNQRAFKPNTAYISILEPVRDQIIYWIAEELHYLNQKQQPVGTFPVNSPATKERTKKVHVDLTVPDLALGARLLLDDVVLHSSYKEIMDLVAKNFRTNRRESLSNNNTYNEGYNISVVTKEKMKGLLVRLQRKIGEF